MLDYIEWLEEGGEGEQETPPQAEPNKTPNENNTDSKGGMTAEEVEKMVAEATTKVKREYSKKLGVNLFDDNEVNTFVDGLKNKVDKTEVDTYKEQVDTYKTMEKDYQDLKIENVLFKTNVVEDYRDKAKKLINVEMQGQEITLEEAAKKVVQEFPMFTKQSRQAGMDLNGNGETLTEREKYVKSNPHYRNNPYMTDK